MKLIALVLHCGFCLMAYSALAAPDSQTSYYLGNQTLSRADGTVLSITPLMVQKTVTPSQNRIEETAITVLPGRPAAKFPMTMTVSGSKFSITDDKGTIHGTGELVGPAWKWNYFKATFISSAGYRIEDENFMSDPDVVIARKRIYDTHGTLIQLMDDTVRRIMPEVYLGLANALLKQP